MRFFGAFRGVYAAIAFSRQGISLVIGLPMLASVKVELNRAA
jgi:hypothetical protein